MNIEKVMKNSLMVIACLSAWIYLAALFVSMGIGHWLWNIHVSSGIPFLLALLWTSLIGLSIYYYRAGKLRWSFLSGFIFLAILFIFYVAQVIYQLVDHFNWTSANPFSILWLPYYSSMAQHKQMLILKVVSGGFVLLVGFLFMVSRIQKGTGSHFQTYVEALMSGLLDKKEQAFYLGKLGFSWASRSGVVLTVTADSRSGKSSSLIIPNAMFDTGSFIVNDNRGDLYPQISESLKERGMRVLKWAPYGEDSHGWNPLLYIRWTADHMMDDLNTIVDVLIPRSREEQGSESFFRNTSAGLLKGLIMYQYLLVGVNEDLLTLEKIIELSVESKLSITLIEIESLAKEQESFMQSAMLISIKSINDASDEKTKSNVILSVQQHLTRLYSPKVIRTLSRNDINLNDIRHKKTAVFIEIPRSNKETMRPFIQLFYTMLLSFIMQEGQFIKGTHEWVTCYLDEFGNMAKVNGLAESVTDMGAFGMRFMFVIHNQGQVIEIYGKHQAKTILGAGIKLLGSTNNYDDLEDFSKGLGDTIRTEYVGQAPNAQKKEERKPLMSPDQIARLNKDRWLVSITGLFPLQLQKGYWFKDRKLKKLLPKNLKPPI